MLTGIIWAVLAGVMLGFYALPEKYTKDFAYANTWGMFFLLNLIIVPVISCFTMINDFGGVLASVAAEPGVLVTMALASILWGVGVLLWSRAINFIGVSLGFSIFIGVVILVGSLLPFIVKGLPNEEALMYILAGLVVVLAGIIFNGRAGIIRQGGDEVEGGNKNMLMGITIAVVGGVLATGFSLANAVGGEPIKKAVVEAGNPEWMAAVAVMFVIYVSGAVFVLPYFIFRLTKRNLWGNFKTSAIMTNLGLTGTMAILNFAASVAFSYAAFTLGKAGGTVGYAIFNTTSVLVAVLSGLAAKEWLSAPNKAKRSLYMALLFMILGVLCIAVGNSFA